MKLERLGVHLYAACFGIIGFAACSDDSPSKGGDAEVTPDLSLIHIYAADE